MESCESMDRAPLLDLADVGAWLGISKDVVYRLSRSGELPAIRIGGSWRFRQADVDRYLDEHMAEQQARQTNRLP